MFSPLFYIIFGSKDTCSNGRLTENVFKRISDNSNLYLNPNPNHTPNSNSNLKHTNVFGENKMA